jgi:hypothetical protein
VGCFGRTPEVVRYEEKFSGTPCSDRAPRDHRDSPGNFRTGRVDDIQAIPGVLAVVFTKGFTPRKFPLPSQVPGQDGLMKSGPLPVLVRGDFEKRVHAAEDHKKDGQRVLFRAGQFHRKLAVFGTVPAGVEIHPTQRGTAHDPRLQRQRGDRSVRPNHQAVRKGNFTIRGSYHDFAGNLEGRRPSKPSVNPEHSLTQAGRKEGDFRAFARRQPIWQKEPFILPASICRARKERS